MSQNIKDIAVKDLVLWTENPRDPINPQSTDQDIADRAVSEDKRSKWSLEKLSKSMGKRFDYSEIPTVSYIDGKPVVFDGNRRVLIGKIIHGYVSVKNGLDFDELDFPAIIPCNVCDKRTALENLDRKHAESGSWDPLERDIFKHKHMKEKKSAFLALEEGADGIISKNPEMNKRFVRDEIFDSTSLRKLGFSTNGGVLKSNYQTKKDAEVVLKKIVKLVKAKEITTRRERGDIEGLLRQDPAIETILNTQKGNFKPFTTKQFQRRTRAIKPKGHNLFGEKLILERGVVSNLYSDLLTLYQEQEKDTKKYSDSVSMIIRFGIRLICDVAAVERKQKLDEYVKANFREAKKRLSEDEKTTLSTQSVNSASKVIELLQLGAHAYTATGNTEQTVALSLIVGRMLQITHDKSP